MSPQRKKIMTLGVELETYSISLPEYRICRELRFPKKSIVEEGERFTRDHSIGSEYNSRVFTTIREAYFLLKSGLRKYSRFRKRPQQDRFVIFPVGGWIDRFAGMHLHFATGKKGIEYKDAKKLASRLHDHLPFLIALCGNSPVWREKVTKVCSNRLILGTHKYFKATRREQLYKHRFRELTYNRGGKKKPPTLEIRICDSSIPEFITAALVVCMAVALRWKDKGQALNRSTTHANYLKARDQAARFGPEAQLFWNNHKMGVGEYADIFFRKFEEELNQMDIPDEVLRVFKYLKKGWSQAVLIKEASRKCQARHRPTWQRQFAKRYATAIEELLDGNSFEQFARRLGVRLPNIKRTWLGRKEARW